jgi:hypothetical protein
LSLSRVICFAARPFRFLVSMSSFATPGNTNWMRHALLVLRR